MIQVLRIAPLHPLLTWRPTALGILIDLLQIELGLLQVAGKPITIPQIDLHVPNNLRVADRVCRLSPLAIVAQGALEVIELPIDPAQGTDGRRARTELFWQGCVRHACIVSATIPHTS